MQRWVDQADDDGIAIHRFKESIEILALVGEKFIERFSAFWTCFGQDHTLNNGQTLRFKEHVLGSAETDAHCTIGTGAARILWIICICPYLKSTRGIAFRGGFTNILAGTNFICPSQKC